jgi:hypothetical protein
MALGSGAGRLAAHTPKERRITSWLRRGLVAVALAAISTLLALPAATPASASVACGDIAFPDLPWCYTVQDFSAPNMTGAYMEQHSNYMTPGDYGNNQNIRSYVRFYLNNGNYIETGIRNGYEYWSDGSCHCNAYSIYWLDSVGTGWNQHIYVHTIAHTTPNGVNHRYQISRGPSPNIWKIFVDGQDRGTSTITGDWLGGTMEVGGAVYAPNGSGPSRSDTFDQYRQWINGSGQRLNWNNISSTTITSGAGFNGTTWGHIDHWYWNKPTG